MDSGGTDGDFLLAGCQSIAEGVLSGAVEKLTDRLENIEQYPFFLDPRVHYGMSKEEVTAVLGEPESSSDPENNEELSVAVAMYTYSWTIGGKEASLDLLFIGDNFCQGSLSLLCAPGREPPRWRTPMGR